MKSIIYISIIFICLSAQGQDKINVYLLPGQGSDCRLFSQLQFDTSRINEICLSYGMPIQNETMSEFASRIAQKIDTTEAFYLIGTSLGGMLATEIAHKLNPEKTILISSAKNRNELPFRYKFQREVPIYKLIPPQLIKRGALFLQPLVEPDRKKYESTFISMLSNKSPIYYRESIALIVNWKRVTTNVEIIHIHGTNDHTIPIRNIDNAIEIENGSHMMTLTRANEIQALIEETL